MVAYLLGRAAAQFARERGEMLGARRWLIYPAILVVSVPLVTATLTVPLVTIPIAYQVFIDPAETYREYVESVDANGIVQFRHGPPSNVKSTHRDVYRLYAAGLHDTVDDKKRVTWHVTEPSRSIRERTLATMDRLPVSQFFAGAALVAFLTVGVALAWWALVGLVRRAFPLTTAAIVFPLLSPTPRGVPWVTVAYMVAFAGWLGVAWALVG